MDPNEALEQIRKHIVFLAQQLDREVPVTDLTTFGCPFVASVSELLDYFTGLDEWLCKGGFLPDPWQRP